MRECSELSGIGKTNLESNGIPSRISQSQKLGSLVCQRSCFGSASANIARDGKLWTRTAKTEL